MEINFDPPMFEVRASFNTACSCHPEYHDIEISASTLKEAAAQLVKEEQHVTPRAIDGMTDDIQIVVRRPVTDDERKTLREFINTAREEVAAKKQVKIDAERQKKLVEKMIAEYLEGKINLAKIGADLLPEAFQRRHDELEVLRLKIAELGGKTS